jgi:hypothetical protein
MASRDKTARTFKTRNEHYNDIEAKGRSHCINENAAELNLILSTLILSLDLSLGSTPVLLVLAFG